MSKFNEILMRASPTRQTLRFNELRGMPRMGAPINEAAPATAHWLTDRVAQPAALFRHFIDKVFHTHQHVLTLAQMTGQTLPQLAGRLRMFEQAHRRASRNDSQRRLASAGQKEAGTRHQRSGSNSTLPGKFRQLVWKSVLNLVGKFCQAHHYSSIT